MAKLREVMDHLANRGAIKRSDSDMVFVFGMDNAGWIYDLKNHTKIYWNFCLRDLRREDWEIVDLNWELDRKAFDG